MFLEYCILAPGSLRIRRTQFACEVPPSLISEYAEGVLRG